MCQQQQSPTPAGSPADGVFADCAENTRVPPSILEAIAKANFELRDELRADAAADRAALKVELKVELKEESVESVASKCIGKTGELLRQRDGRAE